MMALVRSHLGPHRQVVYTLRQLPAPQTKSWLEDDEDLMDTTWSWEERLVFAGVFAFIFFIGFCLGKAL